MSKKLELAISTLLLGNGGNDSGNIFYASLLQVMQRVCTTKIPTMGVSLTHTIKLYYNPDFVEQLDMVTLVEVLKHECDHIISAHPIRFTNIEKGNQRQYNLAADACINKAYKSLHEMGVTVDKIRSAVNEYLKKQGKKVTVNDNESAEYYYQVLGLMKGDGEGDVGDLVDDHGSWEESEGIPKEVREEVLKKELKQAAENTRKAGGNVPNDIQAMIDQLGKSSVNWKQVLRQFFGRVNQAKKESTRMKRNRRYGYLIKGKKKYPDLKIACCLDTSGSVSDEYLNQYISELINMHECGAEIVVIEADCQVQNVYDFDPKKIKSVSGRGGTAYMPAINEALKHDVDAILYLGDGDNFGEILEKPNLPFLWVMIEDNKPPAEWGKVCNIYRGKDA